MHPGACFNYIDEACLRLLFVYARNGMLADMELQSLIIGVSVGVAALFFAAAIVLMIGLGS
jgi:hypothetical protein